MPLGAARIALLAKTQVVAVAEVIRKKIGVSAVGNAQVDTAQSQFGGASAYFDGTGDYLTSTNDNFTFDQTEITIEFWVRPDDAADGTNQFLLTNRTGDLGSGIWYIRLNTDGTLGWAHNAPANIVSGSTSLSDATWHHVAVVKEGGDFNIYLDGSFETSVTSATTGDGDLYIGARGDNTLNFAGFIDEVRISDTARYTTSFTPSTTPFTNDDNTLLLLHMDGTDGSTYFEDDNGVRDKIAAVAVADAQIDTAQSQFGGASALFDRTGDGIRLYNVDSFGVGTGDITIEMWFRSANVSYAAQTLYDQRDTANGNWPALFINNNGGTVKVGLWWNGNYRLFSDQTISANTWYHVALTRESGVWYIYIDGTKTTSSYSASDSIVANDDAQIGFNFNSVNVMDGHIDEVRISDTARYTANFTPATEPFTNDDNTLLLLHMDGVDASTDFEDDNGNQTFNGAVDLGGIYYADDDVDKSSISSSADDWTVSYWFRMDSTATSDQIVFQWFSGSGGSGNKLLIRYETNGDLEIYIVNGFKYLHNFSSEWGTAGDNEWHHLVLSNNGTSSSYECYVDGASVTLSTATPTSINFTGLEGLGIGAANNGTGGDASGIAQFALWYGTAYDLSTNIDKFYDTGIVNMGEDGTASGLAQPTIYHAGNTKQFRLNRGNGDYSVDTAFVAGSADDVIN